MSLHFYYFSTNYYEFSKFTAKCSCNFCRLPLDSSFLITNRSLTGLGRGTEESRPDFGEELAGSEGQVGEEQEEAEGYLSVVLVGTGSGGRVVAGGASARR